MTSQNWIIFSFDKFLTWKKQKITIKLCARSSFVASEYRTYFEFGLVRGTQVLIFGRFQCQMQDFQAICPNTCELSFRQAGTEKQILSVRRLFYLYQILPLRENFNISIGEFSRQETIFSTWKFVSARTLEPSQNILSHIHNFYVKILYREDMYLF